ncbi:MAG: hypothetical protein LBL70_04730, partial [Treponema sp.]|nr:hypothetical protein [Treponema sp.]
FINQIRMKIGVMFGNPETTTGGNALKFYASVRLEVRKIETIEAGKDVDAVGNRVRVKVVKNKVAPPFRRAELDIIFGKGVSAIGSLLDGAVKYELIDKKGAWYSSGEEKIGQGRDSALSYLEQNEDFAKKIEVQLRKLMFPGREFPAPAKKAAGTETAQSPADSGLSAAPLPAGPAVSPVAAAPALNPATGPVPNPVAAPAAVAQGTAVPGTPAAARPAPRPVPVAPPPTRPVPPRPAVSPIPAPEEPAHRGPGRPRKIVAPADPDALF